ncbi:hypothetical protein ETB97_010250 [Aspergillus alliaceus]|uniref:Uncharacterized protein n=1 Tax=Petromyces alliaceus TaxID=209559 RepID=A0A8H6EA18_PETAA|nr:hypothetical protein ETB97_010250 [Aspergillus burnettii]
MKARPPNALIPNPPTAASTLSALNLKYCSEFDTNRDKLSTAGQEWMRTVMLCLQRKLVPFVGGSQNTTCDDLSQFAFGTHPSCYVDSGLCTLPIQDWVAIVDIVSLPTLFGSLDALKATVEAGKNSAEFYLWMLGQHIH